MPLLLFFIHSWLYSPSIASLEAPVSYFCSAIAVMIRLVDTFHPSSNHPATWWSPRSAITLIIFPIFSGPCPPHTHAGWTTPIINWSFYLFIGEFFLCPHLGFEPWTLRWQTQYYSTALQGAGLIILFIYWMNVKCLSDLFMNKFYKIATSFWFSKNFIE